MQTLNPHFVAAGRAIVALTWLYQGFWLKVVALDPHHLEIVTHVGFSSPEIALRLIGLGETLLGLGVLSGILYRWIALFQIVLIVAMNVTGILFGGGSIAHPAGLLIGNLPLLFCIALVGWYGPGSFALRPR
ncbi:DoxX-like family protein [Verrucomicrobiota bacterium sgz303538]